MNQLNNLLKNKYVLYAVFFFAITNVLGFLSIGDFHSLTFFIIIALFSSYFSKNMTVNLLIAIIFTNMFFVGKQIEGMANNNKEKKEALENKGKNGKNDKNGKNGKNGNKSEELEGKNTIKEKKETFGQRNVPRSEPSSIDDDDVDVGKRIDYAATLEQAYGNLQGMLGKDGISGLTKETEKLINQQKNLMGTLNEMMPFIKDTKETLGSFNMNDINKSLGGITQMLGSMGMGGGNQK
jgi:hypothetical protein